MKATDSIRVFLESKGVKHDPAQLETQVNVGTAEGRPVEGKRSTYTDDLNTWWSIRIPKNANSTPEWDDYNLIWPLEIRAEAIGSTGWDWRGRRSLWVGFDFDAIVGHAKGVGVSDDKLAQIREAAKALPWVEVRKSTGGAGLHLYVFFEGDGVPTANHTEHAAMARCVLGMMSAETGFNFAADIDTCGGNMWLWHRRQVSDAYAVLKPATTKLAEPAGWREHVGVIQGKSSKVRLGDSKEVDAFDALASSQFVVSLDDAHRQHIDAMVEMGFAATWVHDHHLLQGHTIGFKRLMEEFDIAGPYETFSPGRHPGEPNCFAFPGRNGSWKIYRFGQGAHEAVTWDQDGKGWTSCWFNKRPTFRSACRAAGGAETKHGGYEFDTLKQAAEVAAMLGKSIEVDEPLANRPTVLSQSKDGRLMAQVAKESSDPPRIKGWNGTDKRNTWTRVFDIGTETPSDDITNYDDKIRCLETPSGQPAGWTARKTSGEWTSKGASSVKTILQRYGHTRSEAEVLMGAAEEDPWTIVAVPFAAEYPGGRQWNRDAPQLAFLPAPAGTDLLHPTWDDVLKHLGTPLDDAVKENQWCQKHGIKTGAQWLLLWFASVIRRPFCKLPYLFFWGPGNSGKSTAHEAMAILVTDGVRDIKAALVSHNDFNAQLENCVLGFIDEHDLSTDKKAESRVKEWVTGMTLSIRRMRCDLYRVPNCLHIIHLGNDPSFCTTLPGDVRKVIGCVPPPAEPIDKDALHDLLRQEAPAFLRTIFDLELPPPDGRMAIAVLDTEEKKVQIGATEPLTEFLADNCEFAAAGRIAKDELRAKYKTWCDVRGYDCPGEIEMGKRLRTISGGAVNTKQKLTLKDGSRVYAYSGIQWKQMA